MLATIIVDDLFFTNVPRGETTTETMNALCDTHPDSMFAEFLRENLRYSEDGNISFAYLCNNDCVLKWDVEGTDNPLHAEMFHREVVDILNFLKEHTNLSRVTLTINDGGSVLRRVTKSMKGSQAIVAGNLGYPCSYHPVDNLVTQL